MKKLLSFEFWQKFGKALMVVVAVMPAAGLMISIGKTIPMINADWAFLITTGGVIENIGWAIIGNLHLLFALAIGGSWAKERAGGAFLCRDRLYFDQPDHWFDLWRDERDVNRRRRLYPYVVWDKDHDRRFLY